MSENQKTNQRQPKNKITILIGRKRAGKDSFIEYAVPDEQKRANLEIVKLADPIKEAMCEIFDQELNFLEADEHKEKDFILSIEQFRKSVLNEVKTLLLSTANDYNDENLNNEQILSVIDNVFGQHYHADSTTIHISPRVFQQKYGTEVCRKFDNDVFCNYLINKINFLTKNTKHDIMVTDVRFPNELKMIVESVAVAVANKNGCRVETAYVLSSKNNQGKLETFNPKYDGHASEKMSQDIEKILLDTLNQSGAQSLASRVKEANYVLKKELTQMTNENVGQYLHDIGSLKLVFNPRNEQSNKAQFIVTSQHDNVVDNKLEQVLTTKNQIKNNVKVKVTSGLKI